VLDLDTRTIDASGGTGYDLVLKGVGVSQGTGSLIKSTTAEIYGSTGNINLFSTLNDFTGQVTVNSTGSQVSLQDANQLSMNSLTGKLANTTSITAWAGTNLVLTPESITTTSGNIDFRSLNGNLSTPGNLTTGAGSVTLIAGGSGSNGNVQVNNTITTGSGNVTVQSSKQSNLSNSIVSTSGSITVTGDTVIHSTGSPGSPLTLQTAGAGTITVNAAGTGGFVMGQYYSYQSASGAISITSGSTADLANITSTSGDVTVNAVGAVQQLASSSIRSNALTVATTSNGTSPVLRNPWGLEMQRGDAAAALASAEVVYDETFTIAAETNNPLGLFATVARWEGDRLTVHDSTQWPTMVRDCLATMFDIPENDVRVLVPYMGGGFGAGATGSGGGVSGTDLATQTPLLSSCQGKQRSAGSQSCARPSPAPQRARPSPRRIAAAKRVIPCPVA